MNRRSAARVSPAFVCGFRRAACLAAAGLSLAAAPAAVAETLSLADCLRETAVHSPEIITQQYAIQQAGGTRLTLRARALPSFGIGGIVGYLGQRQAETLKVPVKDPSTGKSSTVTVTNTRSSSELIFGTFQINQSIFDAAIPASWRRADVGITVAQENFYTVASAQLNQTRTLFYLALFQQENGAVLRRLDDALAGEIKAVDQLVTAGLVGRQQTLALQVLRTNFNTALLTNVGSLQTGLNSLLQNMGRELGPQSVPGSTVPADVHLANDLEDHAVAFDPAAAAREALAARPDLRGLRAMVRAFTEDANIARAGYYPLVRVYLAGELVPQSFVQRTDTNSTRSNDQTQTTEIRPGVTENWTIIDTGAVRGAVRAAEADRDIFNIALQRAERDLPSDLARIRSRMAGAAERIDALRGNVATADNTLTMIQNGLAQGINSEIEILDAQNGVLGSRSGLLAAELEMSLAHAELDRLTGRYLRFIPDAPAAAHHPSVSK